MFAICMRLKFLNAIYGNGDRLILICLIETDQHVRLETLDDKPCSQPC